MWQKYFAERFEWAALSVEHEGIVAFVEQHERTCPSARGLPGSKYQIRFTPSGFGTFVGICCLMCKVEKDVTDIEKF